LTIIGNLLGFSSPKQQKSRGPFGFSRPVLESFRAV